MQGWSVGPSVEEYGRFGVGYDEGNVQTLSSAEERGFRGVRVEIERRTTARTTRQGTGGRTIWFESKPTIDTRKCEAQSNTGWVNQTDDIKAATSQLLVSNHNPESKMNRTR